jgi:hypothetical protein
MPLPPNLLDHVEHFQHRVLVDAVMDAWAVTWERRARALDAAKARPGDFQGRASREDLRRQWQRLQEAAEACRARAHVSPPLDLVLDDLDNVLGEAC